MKQFTILTENEHVSFALSLLFENYKDHFIQFLNNVLKGETGEADAFIQKNSDGVFEIYHTAPDKGHVLAYIEGMKATLGGGEIDFKGVELMEYKNLPVGTKYVIYDGSNLSAYLKTEAGKSDIKFGRFANINDVVEQIDSESVQDAIDNILSAKNNSAVEYKKEEKKAKKIKAALKKASKKND